MGHTAGAPKLVPGKVLYGDTAREHFTATTFQGDVQTDVAIVGGGLTGISAALHLAEAGVSVVLLEAGEIGAGGSGRNGGQVNPGLKPGPAELERDLGPEAGRRLAHFANRAPDLVFDLIRKHSIDCEARQGGTLRAAPNRNAAQALERLAASYVERGMPVELLDRAAVAARTGTDRYMAAMVEPNGGTLNPLAFVQGLARAARSAGARIHTQSRAKTVDRSGTGWRITTGAGRLRAAHLVLATDAYSDDLWPGLRRSLVPVYSAVAASKPLPEALAAQVLANGEALFETGWNTVYYRVDTEGRLIIGGRGRQRDMLRESEYINIIRYAQTLFPEHGYLCWSHLWFGQIAVTPDHYLRLYQPHSDLQIVAGFNGRGVAMATVMGAEISANILSISGNIPTFPVTRAPRPIPLHSYWKLGVTARVLYGGLRDKLDR